MKKILILMLAFLCASQYEEVYSQCTFETPENYGFMCDVARFLCGNDLDGFQGRLLPGKSPQPQPHPICNGAGEADNIQWFSFVADSDDIEISIDFSNCSGGLFGQGLQIGLYSSCELNPNSSPIGMLDCISQQGYAALSLQASSPDVTVGNIYYLFVDGFAGSECDFEFTVVSGVCTEEPAVTEVCEQDCGVTNQSGDNVGCTGITESYTFHPSSQIIEDILGCNPYEGTAELDSIICIDWIITPDVGFTVASTSLYYNGLDVTSSISIAWDTPGRYTLTPVININPIFEICRGICDCTSDVAYTVDIAESTLITNPVIELCPDDCVSFCGNTICNSSTTTCFDRINCEITTQAVVLKEMQFIDLGTYYICDAECFILNGDSYCAADNYEIIDPSACDTSYQFEVLDLDLNITLEPSDDVIDCNNQDASMTASYTTNYTDPILVRWINELGDTVSFTDTYVTTVEGNYTFLVLPIGLEGCSVSIDHLVTLDTDTPDVVLNSQLLDCNNPQDAITLSTSDAIASVLWSGPNGFNSSDLSPTIDEGGLYTAEIIGINGCDVTKSITVVDDFNIPIIDLSYDDFTCSEDLPLAQYTSDIDVDGVSWRLASQEISTDDILVINQVGEYTLTVTGTNGCTTSTVFSVTDLSYDPSLSIGEELIWRCNSNQIDVDISTMTNPALSYVWNTLEGGFIIDASVGGILSIQEPGTFILTSTDPVIGCVGKDTIKVIEDPNLFIDIDFEVIDPECFGGEGGDVFVNDFIGGEGPFTYIHEGSEYTEFEEILFPIGKNDLTIRDFYECEVTKNFEIKEANEILIDTEPIVTIRFGKPADFSVSTNLSDDLIKSIEWSNLNGQILAEGRTVSIDFQQEVIENMLVTVTDINDCNAIAEVRVIIDYNVEIYYPNVFSPNGDGQNDEFILYSSGPTNSVDLFQIYDRAGELIYSNENVDANEASISWDGKFNDSFVQPGVFVFFIKYTQRDGIKRSQTGSITVIR